LRHHFAARNARSPTHGYRCPDDDASPQCAVRVPVTFGSKRGLILLDQLRAVDKVRLLKKLGSAAPKTLAATLQTLQNIFAD
jgi:mRNA-degrading endonuclease toxin of MazEF toxin-antitoxin module